MERAKPRSDHPDLTKIAKFRRSRGHKAKSLPSPQHLHQVVQHTDRENILLNFGKNPTSLQARMLATTRCKICIPSYRGIPLPKISGDCDGLLEERSEFPPLASRRRGKPSIYRGTKWRPEALASDLRSYASVHGRVDPLAHSRTVCPLCFQNMFSYPL